MFSSAEEVLRFIAEENVEFVDVKFVDLPGTWQHFSIPIGELNEGVFSDGLGFDGSSIRGFKHIHESDMLLMLDPASAFVDPILRVPTLSIIGNVFHPVTGYAHQLPRPAPHRPQGRGVSQHRGRRDTTYCGPEAEFDIFRFRCDFDQTANPGYYLIDSEEGAWNTGRGGGPNLGFKPRHKEGYFPVPPTDNRKDLRTEMVWT